MRNGRSDSETTGEKLSANEQVDNTSAYPPFLFSITQKLVTKMMNSSVYRNCTPGFSRKPFHRTTDITIWWASDRKFKALIFLTRKLRTSFYCFYCLWPSWGRLSHNDKPYETIPKRPTVNWRQRADTECCYVFKLWLVMYVFVYLYNSA